MNEPGTDSSMPNDAPVGAVAHPRQAPTRRVQAKNILWEGVLVAMIGAAFAFAANEISPRGLKLSRNYFPGVTQSSLSSGAATNLTPGSSRPQGGAPLPAELLARRLQAKGLYLIESNQVVQLFRDPRYAQELFVFIDARNDRHYQEGHIPGAYQFDHYRADKYLAAVLPACQAAEQIVVYCTGGDCEDSEFAAIILRQAGIPAEKVFVYGGGMTEWIANGLPVEMGARKSGNLRPAKP